VTNENLISEFKAKKGGDVVATKLSALYKELEEAIKLREETKSDNLADYVGLCDIVRAKYDVLQYKRERLRTGV
jgi:hypothetical protein